MFHDLNANDRAGSPRRSGSASTAMAGGGFRAFVRDTRPDGSISIERTAYAAGEEQALSVLHRKVRRQANERLDRIARALRADDATGAAR
ncbi:MAG: hypothetical protein MUF34_34010 [Polyangiaceae bacterium]|nr:hypothetical protein [Polyangiaceae bacterium]